MSEHTPEPWIFLCGEIFGPDGNPLDMSNENMQRIVACVNAFAGIPIDEFEGKDISEFMARQAFLVGAEPSKGGFDLNLQGGACAVLAGSFAGQFVGAKATNYLEVNMGHPSMGEFTVTMQRKSGKSPADLRREAEEQLATVTAQRDELLLRLSSMVSTMRRACQSANWSCSEFPDIEKAEALIDKCEASSNV